MKTTITKSIKVSIAFCFFLSLMAFVQTVFSQSELKVFADWSSTDGSQNFFYKNVTKTDGSNNVYIVGATMNGNNNYDILTAKYNSSGVLQWIQQYNGGANGQDIGAGLYVDGSGNVYVTGTVTTSSTDADIITIKYNSSGTQQWLSTYNGTGGSYDSGAEIVVDSNGDVYITGSSYNATPNTDLMAIKYNSSGTQQWASRYNHSSNLNDAGVKISIGSTNGTVSGILQTGTTTYKWCSKSFNKSTGAWGFGSISSNSSTGIDQVNDMVEDASGNIYIVGATPVSGQGYNYDIIKLTSTLSLAWENTYNSGSNLDDIAKGIKVDASGNVYVTGYTTSSTEGKNITTIKYNSSGTQQWVETFNDSLDGDDEAYAMAIDTSGNIYVSGYFFTQIDSTDYYTMKYDASGNVIWTIHNDGENHLNDKVTNITIDNNQDIVVTGESETAPGEFEYYTIKYVEKDIITPTDYNGEDPLNSFSYYKNSGQIIDTDTNLVPDIKYYAKNSSPEFYIRKNSNSFVFAHVDTIISTTDTLHRIDVAFSKCNTNAKTYPLEETTEYMNYFLAHCSDGVTEIRGNKKLVTTELYPNIDLMYSSNQNGIKYYFIVKPGGDPTDIMMEYDGASSFNLDGTTNELTINSSIGSITYERPTVYQLETDNTVDTITGWTADWQTDSTYNYYQFNIGSYNTAKALIIQVDLGHTQQQQQIGNLDWSTYYGGSVPDGFHDIETDNDNQYSYITGFTSSNNFPPYNGLSSNYFHGDVDATILKFDNTGHRKFVTYYGGTSFDVGYSIFPDNTTGNIYVVGEASSTDFPIQPVNSQPSGAYVDSTSGGSFILELNPNGNNIIWNTYYSSSLFCSITGDNNNNLYIVGVGSVNNTPLDSLPGAYYNSTKGDGLITKFTKQGARLWATFFNTGTSSGNEITSVKTDNSDNVFITGTVSSNDMNVTNPGSGAYFDNAISGTSDAFIAKFNSSDAIVWSTYFGGSGDENGIALNISGSGNLLITGNTSSTNFPWYNPGSPAYCDTTLNGTSNTFISRFSNNGNRLWSTYYGNTDFNTGNDIIAMKYDYFFVVGSTRGLDTLSLSGAYNQDTIANSSNISDAYILGFTFSDNERIWATYFGGSENDFGNACTVSSNNRLYLVGGTSSMHYVTPAFPIVDLGNGAWIQWENASSNFSDGFIARFDLNSILYGIEENTINSKIPFIIYPNPSNGIYTLKAEFKEKENITISVYNSMGQKLFENNSNNLAGSFNKTINLTDYSDGIYFVVVNISGKNHMGKIIKQK
ncbi:MAG: SBBP repeat-containing protein [Candidatus Paceibacterota bacterium]|jgi:hypothetical protein